MKHLYRLILISGFIPGFFACSETDYPTYDSTYTGIYFSVDTMSYAFGLTPLEVSEYVMEIPVKIMGAPAAGARTFSAGIITGKSTAIQGTHYALPEVFTIEADSVNGILPLHILRSDLGDTETYTLGFRLTENNAFIPTNGTAESIVVSFSNKVEPPTWTDYNGDITWPSSYLGPWNPIVWIKFMEYFKAMEQTVPEIYKNMVKQYGPNLEHVTYSWPSDFNYSVKKYIMAPLRQFFEDHPEYGVEIPSEM